MLSAHYLDGRSTRVRVVTLSIGIGGKDLHIVGDDLDRHVPLAHVSVDERLGRAPRRVRLEDGAVCEVRDLHALDILLASMSHRDGWVDRAQRQARSVLISIVVCIALVLAAFHWGLPWAAAAGAHHLPSAIGRALTVQTLQLLDDGVLEASKIAPQRQQSLQAQLQALRPPEGGKPASILLFRASAQLGANAFTLPDGTIIVTDALITSIADDHEIIAVLSHELGHARERHGLQLLLRSSAVGAFMTFYLGDISTLLTLAPAAILQARYSRDLEQEADDYGASLLAHNGMSPGLLADALNTLAATHTGSPVGGYLASHPPTDARMRHLRVLAGSDLDSVRE